MNISKQAVTHSLMHKTKRSIHTNKISKMLTVLVASSMFVACSDNDNDSKPESVATVFTNYEVEIVNLTHNQPFSPLALRTDGADYKAWSIGESASLGMEYIAEAGDNTVFLDSASSDTSTSGTGLVNPGETVVIDLQVLPSASYLTAATMLINTNDAFAGVTGLDLSSLAVGEQTVVILPVYDAGTEANNELAGTIPGPADGGTGFDAQRDDVDFVARHPGVVGSDDGYAESVLDGSHKFDAPVARLKITRVN